VQEPLEDRISPLEISEGLSGLDLEGLDERLRELQGEVAPHDDGQVVATQHQGPSG
jgi:hypothetical protein